MKKKERILSQQNWWNYFTNFTCAKGNDSWQKKLIDLEKRTLFDAQGSRAKIRDSSASGRSVCFGTR